MTYEEMAEEIVKRNVCENCNRCQSHGYIGCDIYRYSKDSFLAGLKAGRPQWYKPGEKLPDQYDKVLNEDGFGVFYDGKYWRNNDAEQDICDEPKYWCEIPTFDKE